MCLLAEGYNEFFNNSDFETKHVVWIIVDSHVLAQSLVSPFIKYFLYGVLLLGLRVTAGVWVARRHLTVCIMFFFYVSFCILLTVHWLSDSTVNVCLILEHFCPADFLKWRFAVYFSLCLCVFWLVMWICFRSVSEKNGLIDTNSLAVKT